MSKNDVVLRQFAEDAGLKLDDFGRASFDADAQISARGKGAAGTTNCRVSFANGDTDQVRLDATEDLVAGKVPLGFNTDFNKWSTAGGVLTIAGTYPGLGAYTATIQRER